MAEAIFKTRPNAERERKGNFVLFGEIEACGNKEWLVQGFLGAGEASAFYGKPGDGKSVLAQDEGMHVAAGRAWHGRKVRHGAVVFVALERTKVVERRAIAFRHKHGLTDLPFAIVGGVYNLRDRRSVLALVDIVNEVEVTTEQPVVLIIIDTLSRALCGGDENSSKDMGAIVFATSLLQERTNAHVQWLHHVPLDAGERMRGHGALLGALDTTIHVTKGEGIRTARVIKTNDSEEGQCVAFTLESIVVGQDAEQTTTAPVVVPVENAPKLIKPIKAKSFAKLLAIILDLAFETRTPYGDDPTMRVKAAKISDVRNEHYPSTSAVTERPILRSFKVRSSGHFTAT